MLLSQPRLFEAWARLLDESTQWGPFGDILETLEDAGELDPSVQSALLLTILNVDLEHDETAALMMMVDNEDNISVQSEIAPSVARFVRIAARQPADGPLCRVDSGMWTALAAAAPSHLADIGAADLASLLLMVATQAGTEDGAGLLLLLHWSEAVDAATLTEFLVEGFDNPADLATAVLLPFYWCHVNGYGPALELRGWLAVRIAATPAVQHALAAALVAMEAELVYDTVVAFVRAEFPALAAPTANN